MIIGLTGKARHGKNTAADMYAAALGGDVEMFAFADPLKEMTEDFDLYVDPQGTRLSSVIQTVGWEAAKDQYSEARRALQYIGTNIVRKVQPTYWLDQARERAKKAIAEGRHVIITDVRFPNEADLIWELGGVVVKVVRPSLENSGDTHSSELGVDEIHEDVLLPNDSTLDVLRERVVESLA